MNEKVMIQVHENIKKIQKAQQYDPGKAGCGPGNGSPVLRPAGAGRTEFLPGKNCENLLIALYSPRCYDIIKSLEQMFLNEEEQLEYG